VSGTVSQCHRGFPELPASRVPSREGSGRKPPTQLATFRTGGIDRVEWARDSRSVVFRYGTLSQDVALISGFRCGAGRRVACVSRGPRIVPKLGSASANGVQDHKL
jgi:hypothetical protein